MIDIKRSTDSHSDGLTQAALAAFIAEGHLARHLRRMRPIYAQRRQTLVRGIEQRLGRWLQVLPGNAGLHLSARILKDSSAAAVLEAARDHLPGALSLAAYAMAKARVPGLCIGYGCVEVDQIARAIRGMGRALDG